MTTPLINPPLKVIFSLNKFPPQKLPPSLPKKFQIINPSPRRNNHFLFNVKFLFLTKTHSHPLNHFRLLKHFAEYFAVLC